ncbi:hypothetical protein E4U54_006092 [Claviceps lovelessii]|nr:hypothetical protein E4U54_006092 [Claviceps lovelessii]
MRLPDSATTLLKPWRRLRSFRRELDSKNLTIILANKIVFASITVFAAVSYMTIALIKARRRQQKGVQAVGRAGCRSFLNVLAPKRKGGQGRYEQTSSYSFDGPSQAHPLQSTSSDRRQTLQQTHPERTPQEDVLVERNLSVRSVITLPAYRALAAHNEQVIGRAGERGGVDVVVNLPTLEEQESLRDEEMETIYQIRLARRQRVAEREEVRRQRQDAQQRGDSSALLEARSQSRDASYNHTVHELRQDVSRIQEQRQRSVSSVSYADLGVARHNGTRLRTSSNEGEWTRLLSDAASFTMSVPHGAYLSGVHGRERSASSLFSVDRDLHAGRSASRVWPQSTTSSLSVGDDHAGSRPELVEVGFGIESPRPPEYESVSSENIEAGRVDNSSDYPPPEYPIISLETERTTSSARSVVSSETETLLTREVIPSLSM